MSTGKSLSPQPYMPLYVGELLAGTVTWSGEERGLLVLMMALAWAAESPLPAEAAKLARMCGYDADRFSTLWGTVSAQFQETERGLIHARVEELREHAREVQRQRADASRKGVAARARKSHGQPNDAPSGEPHGQPSGEPNGEPNDAPFRAGQVRSEKGITEPAPTVPQGGQGRRPRVMTITPSEFERELIDTYHQLLPDHPQVLEWTRTRRRHLRSRIAECKARGEPADTIDYWRRFFASVDTSNYLCGRAGNDDDPFVCDLSWLLLPENFTKVIEGNYGISHGSNGQDGGAAYAL